MRIPLLVLSIMLFALPTLAQSLKELDAGYYTVVAAYANSREEYAQWYVKTLQEKGMTADYGFNSSRGLFFVYVQSHDNLRSALTGLYEIRTKEEFKDAWVRVVPGVIGQRGESPRPAISEAVEVETKSVTAEPVIDKSEAPTSVDVQLSEEDEAMMEEEEKVIQYHPMTLGNSEIFLSLYNAANNRIIDGDIQVMDTDRGRLLKIVKGNEYLSLPDPKNESGKITLICDVFGYRKLKHDINFRNPEADTALAHVDMMGLSFVVLFDLLRPQSGTVQTMSRVQFYNDAAIMMPESRYELDQLLQMMEENPQMRIRIHGHTNGNYHGKIIKMGPEKNFFKMGKDVVNTVGSSKELSSERAKIIKEYLVANKIAEDRIEVNGWGGKKPLFDKHSANARRNVRVEVEVIAE